MNDTLHHDNSISAFARLLATENIVVRHSREASTASFDVVSRILTLPRWKNMTDEVYDMLVGHEVAHALWTDSTIHEETGSLQACVDIDPDAPQNVLGILNIVEDARIERLIKSKYPGLKRDFAAGYKYLHEIDVFELAERGGVSKLGFLDRLNLHFKLGILGILKVPFENSTEIWFRDRITAATTWDDVVEISRDLYEYEMQQQEEREQPDAPTSSGNESGSGSGQSSGKSNDTNQSDNDTEPESSGQGDGGETEQESDAGGSTPNSSGGESGSNMGTKTPTKEKPEIATQEAMDNGLVEQYSRYVNDSVESMPTPRLDKMIVDAATLRADHEDSSFYYSYAGEKHPCPPSQMQVRNDVLAQQYAACDDFMNSEKSTVNYLAKQFEMRKAADEHKRTMISKSGRLDPVKMINYRWSEDIFAKNTTVRDGKNHGFVIVVDWSGSMMDNLVATVKQAITLAMFCRKVGIPFDLYSFSDRTMHRPQWDANGDWIPDENIAWEDAHPTNGYFRFSDLRMLNFLSSSMNQREFQAACRVLFSVASNEGAGYQSKESHTTNHPSTNLGGTPLDETLVALHWIVPQFRQRHNLQVVNTVLLSDGCGCQRFDGVIINPITRISYGARRHEDRGIDSTCLLLQSLKETTGSNLIGMYLCTSKNPIRGVYGSWLDQYDLEPAEEKTIRSSWKKNRYYVATGRYSNYFDEAYIIDARSNPESDINLPDSAKTQTQLRNAFVKGMKSRGMSRNLVNRFVEAVAR
jgi:hypothetical protein